MKDNRIRFGILGTANIARKNWRAIFNSGNSLVTMVASRDLQKSARFIAECQSEFPFDTKPQAVGSYETLLETKEIDAVYIPLPTGMRKEWVMRAAEKGKHVVCEKPCAITIRDLEEMIDCCKKNKVQFMDGVMFMHSQRLESIRSVLEDGTSVGPIKRVASQFSFCAPDDFFKENIRMHSELEPHGCLGDLGWYNIRLLLWLMKWELPVSVSGRMLSELSREDSPQKVPTEFSAELLFSNGVSAGFYCSFLTENQQWANISGTHGYLHVEDFVLPFFGHEIGFKTNNAVFNVKGCSFNMEDNVKEYKVNEYSNGSVNAQETNLFRNFSKQIQSGTLQEEWMDMTLNTQKVMEACLTSARNQGTLVQV